MKAQLMLERLNHDRDKSLRAFSRVFERGPQPPNAQPWVAKLSGLSERFGFERKFLESSLDYAQANSTGSRGIRACYILESGKAYEVFEKTSWRSSLRYFCTVTPAGDIIKISREEAETIAAHVEIDDQAQEWKTGKKT